MVYGQYDKDKAALEQPAAAAARRDELGRTSKAYVAEDDRQHAQLLAASVQSGMLPHNQQLTEILDRIDASLARQVGSAQLSSEGQKVAQDFQSVVGATREAIEEKNQDELLQKIVYTTGRATQALATDPTAQQRARLMSATMPTRQRLLDGINNLARQLTMSTQFRDILFQLNGLVRELLLDEDESVSGVDQGQPQGFEQQQQQQGFPQGQQQQGFQQGQQGLGQVGQGQQVHQTMPLAPPPESEGLYGMSYGQIPTKTPVPTQQPSFGGVSTQQPSFGGVSTQQPSFGGVPTQQPSFGGVSTQQPSFGVGQSMPPQQQSSLYDTSYGQLTSFAGGQGLYGVQQQGGQGVYGGQGRDFTQGVYQGQGVSQSQGAPVPAPRSQGGVRPGENWQPPASLGAIDQRGDLAAQGGSSSSQQVSARRVTGKARQLIQKEMSPAKKQRIVQRWIAIIRRANSDPGVRGGLDTLMDLSTELQESGTQPLNIASDLPPSKAEIEAESFIIAARHHLRRLVENLAGGRSLDFLRMAMMDFQRATANDDVFNRYTGALKVFLQRSFNDPQFVNQADYDNTCLMMLEGAQQVARRHEDPTERLLFEVDELEDAIRNDEVTHKLGTTSLKLVQDLFYNEQGRMTFKPQLIDDLRQILIPIIADQLRYIAIPKITGSDDDMDYEVDNIIFRAKDVLPSNIRLENRALLDVNVGTQSQTPNYWDSALLIRISDIVAELRDIKFAYRRKKFPKLHDRGELDVVLGGRGIGIDSELLAARNDPAHLFRVGNVHCTCSKIDIENMAGEEHRMMYTLLKPIIESRVRRNIIMSVEETVHKVLIAADEKLFQMRRMTSSGSSVQGQQGNVIGMQGQQGSVFGMQGTGVPGDVSSTKSNVGVGVGSGDWTLGQSSAQTYPNVGAVGGGSTVGASTGGSQLDPKGAAPYGSVDTASSNVTHSRF